MEGIRRTPQQHRAVATQEAVIEGAAAVFDRIGYGNASLSMIAESSGISQGAMYFHFKSKEQIALAVVHAQHARSLPLFDTAANPDAPAFEQLVRISYGMARQLLDDVVVRAGVRLALETGALSEPAAGFYEDWVQSTAVLLKRALDSGELVSRTNAEWLGRTLIGFFTGVQMVSQATTDRENLMDALAALWDVVADAIVPPAGRERALALLAEVFGEGRTC